MSTQIADATSQMHELKPLLEDLGDRFAGYVVRCDYDNCTVLTTDAWKSKVGGIPMNCLLIATTRTEDNITSDGDEQEMVLLLRVLGPSKIPQDDANLKTLIENHQRRTKSTIDNVTDDMEPITQSMISFHGLECNILGTFFQDQLEGSRDKHLKFGADIEDFHVTGMLRVYRPSVGALGKIVNYVDPIRRQKAEKDAKQAGFDDPPESIEIAHVRYTSSNKILKVTGEDKVSFKIHPMDFIARRTGVFGMTRTGKSNTIKTMISMNALAAAKSKNKVGQIIFDLNGEYANANKQDAGSIADVFKDNTVRFRGRETDGFFDIRENFFDSLEDGLSDVQNLVETNIHSIGNEMRVFLNLSLQEPDRRDSSAHNRWQKKRAIYLSILKKGGLQPGRAFKVRFPVAKKVLRAIYDNDPSNEEPGASNDDEGERLAKEKYGDPVGGFSLDESIGFFEAVRRANIELKRENEIGITSTTSGSPWLDDDEASLLTLLAQKNEAGQFRLGFQTIVNSIKEYHSPTGAEKVSHLVYEHLYQGRIVIVDLSVGLESIAKARSKTIAKQILQQSLEKFLNDEPVPNILIYVEEAHNLIGKNSEPTEIWPRIAKEGAKAGISLIYATQEPSTVQPNILANTENIFATHLNNDDEVKVLAKYYDFADFSKSIKKAQDVGFARIKTLSSAFVVPAQIKLFEPEKVKMQYEKFPKDDDFEEAPSPAKDVSSPAKDVSSPANDNVSEA